MKVPLCLKLKDLTGVTSESQAATTQRQTQGTSQNGDKGPDLNEFGMTEGKCSHTKIEERICATCQPRWLAKVSAECRVCRQSVRTWLVALFFTLLPTLRKFASGAQDLGLRGLFNGKAKGKQQGDDILLHHYFLI